jgi:hypothetical protein
MQLALREQPARFVGAEMDIAGGLHALRLQPAKMGMCGDTRVRRDAL